MNEKIRPKYFKTFLLSGVAFGLLMWAFFASVGYPSAGRYALIAGFLFGFTITIVVKVGMARSDSEQKEMLGDKPVVLSGVANHLMPLESVGGWLYLTQNALCFKSHDFNVQAHETVVPLTEIKSIETFSMFWIVPNGLRLITINGKESFVVNNRKRWMEKILSHRSA